MITKGNIKEVLNMLTAEEKETAINGDGDYIELWLHVYNTGGVVTIESKQYNEEEEQQANDHGQLFCDKDSFINLLDECNIAH